MAKKRKSRETVQNEELLSLAIRWGLLSGALIYIPMVKDFSNFLLYDWVSSTMFGGFVGVAGWGISFILELGAIALSNYQPVEVKPSIHAQLDNPQIQTPAKIGNYKVVSHNGKKEKWAFDKQLSLPSFVGKTSHSITTPILSDDLFTMRYISKNGNEVVAQITGRLIIAILKNATKYHPSIDRGKSLSRWTLGAKLGKDNYKLLMTLFSNAKERTGIELVKKIGNGQSFLNYRWTYTYIVVSIVASTGEGQVIPQLPPTPLPRIADDADEALFTTS